LTQVLLQVNDDRMNPLVQSRILWQDSRENAKFVLVPYIEDVAKIEGNYKILDKDVEGNEYYWIYAMGMETIDAIPFEQNILWKANRTALIKVQNPQIFNQLPRLFKPHRINFCKSPRAPEFVHTPLLRNTQEAYQMIQAIIDAVNIDSLYQTERHITGEEPFYLNGIQEFILSRYSYDPQIYIAQDYLEQRLESLGYQVESHPFGGTFFDVKFAPGTSSHGWTISSDRIYGTTDGGENWNTQYSGAVGADLWSIFPLNNQTVYAVGDYGTILKTSDGGGNWGPQSSPVNGFLFGVYFSDSNLGWIAGDNGNIMKTTDGGTTWVVKSTPTSNRLYDIYFINQ